MSSPADDPDLAVVRHDGVTQLYDPEEYDGQWLRSDVAVAIDNWR